MLLTLLALACTTEAPAPERRPNILLVTLDTTRVDALACYGNREAHTPTLDRLAEEGTRFSRAFSVTPLTIPAHSSIFTGLYPPRHGVRDNGDFFLGPEADTLAERLRGAGYETAAAVGAEVTSHHWGFQQGFDAYFDDMGPAPGGNRWRVERPADQVVDDALGWLLPRRDSAAPWFAWVHFFDAHNPYAPPEPHAARFPEHPYLGEIAFVDAQLARLLEGVDLDQTWVIAIADHGEGMGSHGELLHGVLLYNATVRVPFIVRPPGGAAARYAHFPVSHVDVLPTLLALADAPPASDVDGMDLSPWLVPQAEPPPPPQDRTVYIESLYAWRHYGWASQRAVVTGGQKLIDSTTPELYGREDYAERSNLAPQAPEAVAALQQEAQALTAALSAGSVAQQATLDAAQLAQLEALGYMTALAGHGDGDGSDGFGAGLPDPVDRLPVLKQSEESRQAFQAGDLDRALEAAVAVLEAEPGLAQPRHLRAQILWRQGKRDEAMAQLQILYDARPSAQVEISMALMRLETGDPEGGLALLSSALEREPYLDGAWQPYLRTLYLLGELEALDAALDTVAQSRPALGTAAVLRASRAVQRGEAGAPQQLSAAIDAHPEEPIGRAVLAAHLRLRGDSIAAEQLLRDELALAPAPGVRQQLIELLAEQRRHDEQLAEIERLLAQVPPDAMLLHARAQALFNLGRHAESLAACDRCLDLDPGAALCKLLSANALQKLGRDAEARAAYAAARAMAGLPDDTP